MMEEYPRKKACILASIYVGRWIVRWVALPFFLEPVESSTWYSVRMGPRKLQVMGCSFSSVSVFLVIGVWYGIRYKWFPPVPAIRWLWS